jgi:hypothetical protein
MGRLLTRAPTDRGVSRRGGSDRAGLFQLVFSLFSVFPNSIFVDLVFVVFYFRFSICRRLVFCLVAAGVLMVVRSSAICSRLVFSPSPAEVTAGAISSGEGPGPGDADKNLSPP